MRPAVHVGVVMLARSPSVDEPSALTRDLPAAEAEALGAAVLLDTIEAVVRCGWPLHLFVPPGPDRERLVALIAADAALSPRAADVHLHPAVTGEPGVRMADAAARTIAAGDDVVVVVRPDVPDLPPNALRAAVDAVAGSATGAVLALGPAGHAGFYLAATSAAAALSAAFMGVTWDAPGVLDAVTRRAEAAGCRVRRVLPWSVVDTRDDLAALLGRTAVTGRAPRVRRVAGRIGPA